MPLSELPRDPSFVWVAVGMSTQEDLLLRGHSAQALLRSLNSIDYAGAIFLVSYLQRKHVIYTLSK